MARKMAQDMPQPPLGPTGQALWDGVNRLLILEGPHEELMLRELCRCADELDGLRAVVDRDGVMLDSSQGQRAHPALVELRQARLEFARLASALGLPSGLSAKPGPSVRGVYSLRVAGQ